MANLLPISTYNLAIDPFMPVAAIEEDYPITIRITLAAISPEPIDDKNEPSTLRLLKRSSVDDFDSEDEDSESENSEDELDEEEIIKQIKKNKKAKAEKEEEQSGESGSESGSDSDSEGDLDDDVSEFVICTLSPTTSFQQAIDITINPDEEVYFVVTGSYSIHLSGNYVEHPADLSDSEDDDEYIHGNDDEYDLTPDEDELIDLEDLEDEEDIEGKIQELVDEDDEKSTKKRSIEEEPKQSKKSKKETKKEKEDKKVQFTKELEQGPTGSTLVEKSAEPTEKKSKKEKAKEAKAKKDANKAEKEATKESAKEEGSEKKFTTKTLLGGVITEDRKVGKGSQAKGGNKVGIRYIGKLKNGKVFDKNTSGKPFVFNLGKGECIKGFDLGVAGMTVGGERRVVIPAKMGYGSQALPGIPANSELTFDIKLVSLK